jgi:hypothetical protein
MRDSIDVYSRDGGCTSGDRLLEELLEGPSASHVELSCTPPFADKGMKSVYADGVESLDGRIRLVELDKFFL